MTTAVTTETLKLQFTHEFADDPSPIDYYIDVDDEETNSIINVYIDDVEASLVNSLSDEELCEHFGLDPEYLVHTNRTEFQ